MQRAVVNEPIPPAFNVWRGTLAGASASLVGIGLARFAYTPLLPAIVSAHWFPASTAAYLGAANLGGYLAGALAGGWLARRFDATFVLRAMMLLVTVAFVACAFPVSFLWFFGWRFASGLAGGALMVLAAPTVLAHVTPSRKGFASGAIFSGIGLGIAASGTIVPILLRQGLMQTWLGLAAISLALTAVAWNGWPGRGESAVQHRAHHRGHGRSYPAASMRALYTEYALNAVGLVPHMIFLVDFVARGLGKGLDAGAQYWVLFGLGAIVGPLLSGHLADRTGFGPALRVAYLLQIVAVALPAVVRGPAALIVSSVVVGAFVPGIVALVLGRVNELLAHHPAAQKGAWSAATTSFAVLQAVAAYGLSFLFAHDGGNYATLFVIGAASLALALAVDLFAALRFGSKQA
ncbi:YbfB/YjiJ family MFS transporter [Paraburkholderia phytofirmans]|uniref:YbfB/YjiJ family MFS transporter n=1 Tax=Paraburkholderia sp. BL9I2N2 TaxID=1938809 RepID=UPI0010450007|nr:YbfB/YjiJ family MFS transporter [Paraburkholderia sp. BL9I2N2]TCK86156.1 putative MFS family arabinose efflux permease [Paraburkholderia sp. BL9I2N2]